jgi:hypothetical protein
MGVAFFYDPELPPVREAAAASLPHRKRTVDMRASTLAISRAARKGLVLPIAWPPWTGGANGCKIA